jgi:hypothetical protein
MDAADCARRVCRQYSNAAFVSACSKASAPAGPELTTAEQPPPRRAQSYTVEFTYVNQ